MDKTEIYTSLEILCVFFWFVFDGFWLLEWKALTYIFCALSLLMAVAMFFYIKREKALVLIALADSSWLACNITWALGDLSQIQTAVSAAKVLFLLGIMFFLGAFYVAEARKRISNLVLSRLRIMKFFERK
ncbi:MAG TPA: hypothetical protein VJC12_01435 [Candidatus Paceibacterota bacterium]